MREGLTLHRCPVCEGRRVTGRLVYGECPTPAVVAGIRVNVVGAIFDRPCGTCAGTGEVGAETLRRLTGGR